MAWRDHYVLQPRSATDIHLEGWARDPADRLDHGGEAGITGLGESALKGGRKEMRARAGPAGLGAPDDDSAMPVERRNARARQGSRRKATSSERDRMIHL